MIEFELVNDKSPGNALRRKNASQSISNKHVAEIYEALKRRMNPKTRNLFPRWKKLGRELGISEATVMRNVRYMINNGMIRREFLPCMNPAMPEKVGFTVISIPEQSSGAQT